MISKAVCTSTLITLAGIASGNVIVSYSYTDLDGTYDAAAGVFTAEATDNGVLATGGDVSLLVGSQGTAQYDTGFYGTAFADVKISMSITNVTATSADGVGTIVISDLDNDQLTANFTGTWTILDPFGFMFFSGATSDYMFTDNGVQDGTFDGSSGSFDMTGLLGNLFDGAVSLLLQNPGAFSDDFAKVSTQADGILIPTPGALLIAGVGAMSTIIPRRRR